MPTLDFSTGAADDSILSPTGYKPPKEPITNIPSFSHSNDDLTLPTKSNENSIPPQAAELLGTAVGYTSAKVGDGVAQINAYMAQNPSVVRYSGLISGVLLFGYALYLIIVIWLLYHEGFYRAILALYYLAASLVIISINGEENWAYVNKINLWLTENLMLLTTVGGQGMLYIFLCTLLLGSVDYHHILHSILGFILGCIFGLLGFSQIALSFRKQPKSNLQDDLS